MEAGAASYPPSWEASVLEDHIMKATDPNRDEADWSLIHDVCEALIRDVSLCEDAVLVLQACLRSKTATTQKWWTLLLLDSIMRNGPMEFVVQVAKGKILLRMQNLATSLQFLSISQKSKAEWAIEGTIFRLVRDWAMEFPRLKSFKRIYEELLKSDVNFPQAKPVKSKDKSSEPVPIPRRMDARDLPDLSADSVNEQSSGYLEPPLNISPRTLDFVIRFGVPVRESQSFTLSNQSNEKLAAFKILANSKDFAVSPAAMYVQPGSSVACQVVLQRSTDGFNSKTDNLRPILLVRSVFVNAIDVKSQTEAEAKKHWKDLAQSTDAAEPEFHQSVIGIRLLDKDASASKDLDKDDVFTELSVPVLVRPQTLNFRIQLHQPVRERRTLMLINNDLQECAVAFKIRTNLKDIAVTPSTGNIKAGECVTIDVVLQRSSPDGFDFYKDNLFPQLSIRATRLTKDTASIDPSTLWKNAPAPEPWEHICLPCRIEPIIKEIESP